MNKTEQMKEFFNECITKDLINSEDLAINYIKVAKDYIEQLETKEQKLIERIENEQICCLQKNNRIENIIQEESKMQVEAYKKHILKILKGEKE